MAETDPVAAPARLPVSSALRDVELQDHLLSAHHDLERLHELLADAGDGLLALFHGALALIDAGSDAGADATLARVRGHLVQAVVALQFQDMTSQLIGHTQRRLNRCIDTLGRDAIADDEDGVAVLEPEPIRANPVAQAEMTVGSIELF